MVEPDCVELTLGLLIECSGVSVVCYGAASAVLSPECCVVGSHYNIVAASECDGCSSGCHCKTYTLDDLGPSEKPHPMFGDSGPMLTEILAGCSGASARRD